MNLNNKHINTYNENGVIVLKKIFKTRDIQILKKEINKYIKNYQNRLKGKEINFIDDKINSIHKFRVNFFNKFANQKKIKKLGDFFLNSKCKVKHYEYFAKPKKIGLESPMHQDNFYWNLINPNALTMWIAIDKADKINGSLDYLIGSHHRLFRHQASNAPGSSQKVSNIKKLKKKYKLKSFNLKPGDCLIHHSQVVHGSKRNKSSRDRRGFTIQLIPRGAKINKARFIAYQKSLEKQIKNRLSL